MAPGVGDFVEVRGRSWLVREVGEDAGGATIARLVGIDDDAQGRALDVVWDAEISPRILSSETWETLTPGASGAEADTFAAYLRVVRWNTATAADRDLFQAPFRAGIRLDPYQLAPLRKALALPRVNVLIADDTGLGKTIEAGLVVRELMIRRRADYIVVAAPASMIGQWRDELRMKFGLDFTIVDREHLAASRRAHGFQVNPWRASSAYIVSHSLLIDETYAAGLRDALSAFRPRALLILDEAHHAAPSGGSLYAVDSQFTDAVRDLADRFEHRLFLSATPHNGHSNSFSALLEMLDPQRFTRGVPVKPKDHKSIVVRRLKSDLRALGAQFPERRVERIDIDAKPDEAPEIALSHMLAEYGRLRRVRFAREGARAGAGRMGFAHLQQRLFSSVPAFAKTLAVHAKTLERLVAERQEGGAADAVVSVEADADEIVDLFGETDGDVEIEAAIEADATKRTEASALADVAGARAEDVQRELDAVREMQAAAHAIGTKADARVKWLSRWIRQNMMEGEAWNSRRLIIFTEWEDTRRWLQNKLEAEFAESDRGEERIDVFTGATGTERRESVKRRFNADPDKEPIRILICTDAAREGLNLQTRCADLVHFDLPWNPARLEQRNGRIDRKLQPEPIVYCRYFHYRHRPEDVVLAALVRKSERIREQLGSMGAVLGDGMNLEARGIEDAEAQARAIDEADTEKIAAAASELDEDADTRRREASEEVADLERRLARSADRVGLDLGELERVFAIAMKRSGVDVERARGSEVGTVQTYRFDPEDPGFGSDSGWADALDEIRVRPRMRRERYGEWREAAPVRAIAFRPPILGDGRDADDVVQVHLEHRLVRKAVSRLSSHAFRRDLERVCAIEGPGAKGRAILLGRLIVFGAEGQRLHEEVVTVSAFKTPGADQAISPLGERGDESSLKELETALGEAKHVDSAVYELLRKGCADDVAQLSPEVERRALVSLEAARSNLKEVGRAEAASLRAVLDDQIKRIEKRQREEEIERGDLLERMQRPEERRQLEADRAHWRRKLDRLTAERQSEPARVKAAFEVAAHRIEAIGMIYIMPKSGAS